MKLNVAIYLGGVLLVVLGSLLCAFIFENDWIPVAVGQLLLSVLSYPLGVFASLILFVLIYMGLATPTEAIFITMPVFALLGYLQWYRIIPAFYRK